MVQNLINCFNWIFIIIWAGVLGFLSLGFFLGTIEGKQKLMEEPISTFLGRFAISGLAGIVGIGILVLINYFLNKTVLSTTKRISLKGLALKGMIVVLVACSIGALPFVLF